LRSAQEQYSSPAKPRQLPGLPRNNFCLSDGEVFRQAPDIEVRLIRAPAGEQIRTACHAICEEVSPRAMPLPRRALRLRERVRDSRPTATRKVCSIGLAGARVRDTTLREIPRRVRETLLRAGASAAVTPERSPPDSIAIKS